MSAIAGFWALGGGLPAETFCRRMLDRLAAYGPHDTATKARGDAALGRCLYRMLPEDRWDRQPLATEDGKLLMVADVRIDNRDELLAELGTVESPELPDSEILFRGWIEWGDALLDRIVGDFAFAVWDQRRESLTLVRDTSGERPLQYCQGAGFFAFATMAPALLTLPGMASKANEERMAQFVADLPAVGPRGYYEGVTRVEPGWLVRISRGGVERRRYWDPRRREIRLPRPQDYGDALREQLDRAVSARLRRASGPIGTHLSSGFDSSAVATAAATLLANRGERLFAFTSAPRRGFDGLVPAGRFADESRLAAATAALHPNIDQIVVRPSGQSGLTLFDADHRDAGQPVGHVCNNVWYTQVCEAAHDRGVGVMLTGDAGNFTISAGLGLDELPNFLRRGRLAAWARESRALVRGGYRWKNIANASLAPWLPRRLYLALRNLRQPGFSTGAEDLTFVAPGWKAEMTRQGKRAGWSVAPALSSKDRRWELLQTFDSGSYRKRTLTRWGIEERDPTADRRLVEFCFSLPSEAYLADGVRRPAMRRALAGRLPPEVMEQKLRGYQMADWYEQFAAEDIRAFVRQLREQGDNGIVDLDALEAAAASWPTGCWHHRPVIYFYRTKLLRALSASHFIRSAAEAGHG